MNDNRISGAVSALGEHGIIGNKEVVFDTMTLDETITGSGGLTLGWNSITGNPIAPGPYGGYFLMNPYFPVLNEDGSYRYDVKLSEVAACLERKHFYINDEVSEIPLYSIPYTGPASVLISSLQPLADGAARIMPATLLSLSALTVTPSRVRQIRLVRPSVLQCGMIQEA